MRVCLDTNVLAQLFTPARPFTEILDSILAGRLSVLVSTDILLEYEEVLTREFGRRKWRNIEAFFTTVSRLHGTVVDVSPQYRFNVIASDPDDNKFVDCAIAGEAAYIVTNDAHFSELRSAGYKPQAITPDELSREL